MQDFREPNAKSFTAFRSAAEEAGAKREKAETNRDEQKWDNEGGHMSSTAGRVTHVPYADLPYVVVLAHQGSETTEHPFATMREAEAFIKRNTPVPGAVLSTVYDRPPAEQRPSFSETESAANDERILARLEVINQRLRQMSTQAAAAALARGMNNAGMSEQEKLRLIAETERILDRLDGR